MNEADKTKLLTDISRYKHLKSELEKFITVREELGKIDLSNQQKNVKQKETTE